MLGGLQLVRVQIRLCWVWFCDRAGGTYLAAHESGGVPGRGRADLLQVERNRREDW